MRLITIRFAFGSAILLLVDILWVASSEITEYLYHDKNFNKPFFTAYAKSVMFVVYLLGFIFCDSWWVAMKSSSNRIPDYYSSISDSDQQNLTLEDDEDEDEDEDDEEEEDEDHEENHDGGNDESIESNQSKLGDKSGDNLNDDNNISINCNSTNVNNNNNNKSSLVATKLSPSSTSPYLSDSIWVPMKHCSDTSSLSGKSSETEDDESVSFEGDVTIETTTIPGDLNSVRPSSHHNHHNHRDHSSSISSTNSLSSNEDQHKTLLNVNFKKKKSKQKKSKKDYSKLSDEINSRLIKERNGGRNVRFSKLIEVRQLSDKHAEDAFLSRLSYGAFMRFLYNRNQQQGLRGGRGTSSNGSNRSPNFSNADLIYKGPKLNVKETAMLAFYFTSIWFAANLSFHVGLGYSEAGLVNILSSTTPLFTLLLGIIFPSGSSTDAISLTKLLSVMVCISSVAVLSTTEPISHHHPQHSAVTTSDSALPFISNSDPILLSDNSSSSQQQHIIPLGSIWTLCGAFFYSVYIVLMRYNVAHDSMLNFPMFFGFIGLFSTILMWPIILLLHVSQLEVFEWPTKEQWFLILVNGLCGTVISELLWLFGSFMTSSLVGTIAVSFTIPLAVFFDVYFKEVEYPRLFFLGALPMFFSFVAIIVVSQYENWDPILAMLDKCVKCIQFIPSSSNSNIRNTPSSTLSSSSSSAATIINPTTGSNNSGQTTTTITHIDNDSSSSQLHQHLIETETGDDETVSNINGNVVIDPQQTSTINPKQQSNNNFFHRFLPSSSPSIEQPPITSTSDTNITSSSAATIANNRRFDSKSHSKFHRNKADHHSIAAGSSLLSSSTLSSTTARLYNFDHDVDDDDNEQTQSLIEADRDENNDAYA